MKFGGVTYEPARDEARLTAQYQRVEKAMRDGEWHTPRDLERLTGDGWASISARLRDMRKPDFGGHLVERKSLGKGLFAYRLVIRDGQQSMF